MASIMPDPAPPFGERVARRLRAARILWLTTVGRDGTPQPNPVWYICDGETFLTYNRDSAARLAHIRRDPHVSLNFDSNGQGGDIIVFTGEAWISSDEPSPLAVPEYLAKYREAMIRLYQTPERFAELYSVPVRIRPTKVRGF